MLSVVNALLGFIAGSLVAYCFMWYQVGAKREELEAQSRKTEELIKEWEEEKAQRENFLNDLEAQLGESESLLLYEIGPVEIKVLAELAEGLKKQDCKLVWNAYKLGYLKGYEEGEDYIAQEIQDDFKEAL